MNVFFSNRQSTLLRKAMRYHLIAYGYTIDESLDRHCLQKNIINQMENLSYHIKFKETFYSHHVNGLTRSKNKKFFYEFPSFYNLDITNLNINIILMETKNITKILIYILKYLHACT